MALVPAATSASPSPEVSASAAAISAGPVAPSDTCTTSLKVVWIWGCLPARHHEGAAWQVPKGLGSGDGAVG